MNMKRYLIATAVVFLFIFFFEWLVHGFIMMGLYTQTESVWREFGMMHTYMPVLILFKLALAAWFTYVYFQWYGNSGVKHGILFGIYFGVFAGLLMSSWYIWLPIPPQLGLGWFITGLVEWVGAGALLGYVYRA